MKKPVLYTELTYLFGIILLAFGSTVLVKADFGISVVIAPAYLLHLKLSETWSFVSFGVAEYIVQGILLVLLILAVRRFHWSYLFAFFTALFYGVVLDFFMLLFSALDPSLGLRFFLFALGVLFTCVGVCFCLHTYISPEVYELLIKELAAKYQRNTGNLKLLYDGTSCLLSIVLAIAFFGPWPLVAIGPGTIFCALFNGQFIKLLNRLIEKHFKLQARFPKFETRFAPPRFHDPVLPEHNKNEA